MSRRYVLLEDLRSEFRFKKEKIIKCPRLSVQAVVAICPHVWHQMVLNRGANRLQCVGRAKRLQCFEGTPVCSR